MEITEKWLGEIGGWQAIKVARMLVSAGKVQVTERTSSIVRGHVGGEKTRVNAGFLIRSRSDVENLCTCSVSRRSGQICEHSLAVGLASLVYGGTKIVENRVGSGSLPSKLLPSADALKTASAPGPLSLYLSESLFQFGALRSKGTIAFLKVDAGETEISLLAGWLKFRGVPLQNCPLALSSSDIDSLLIALAEHPRVFIGKPGMGMHRPLIVVKTDIRPQVRIQFCGIGKGPDVSVSMRLTETPAPQLFKFEEGSAWLYHVGVGTIHPWRIDLKGELGQIAQDLLSDTRPEKEVVRPVGWMPTYLASMEEAFQIDLDQDVMNRYKVASALPHFVIEVSGSLQKVSLKISAEFQGCNWSITSNRDPFPIQDQQSETCFYVRNVHLERQLFDELSSLGFGLSGSTGLFELTGTREVMRFFGSGLPKLENSYSVMQTDTWRAATAKLRRISPRVDRQSHSNSSGIDWLTMEFAYEATSGFRISRSDALRLLRSGQNTLKGRDGSLYVLDSERCEELEDALQDVPVKLSKDGMSVGSAHEAYFSTFTDKSKLAVLTHSTADQLECLGQLGALATILRPYQIEGVSWIVQRLKAGQGALLGDDMGLGKTLQSIAAIRCLFCGYTDVTHRPALVVCPKSLIGNWQSEFERFAPELRVLGVQGANRRELFGKFNNYDVLITSYPLIARDLKAYQEMDFCVGVFDESSFVKNPDTEAASAARGLHLRSRLALSGTPVENGVSDLWSVFEILIPGYLGNRSNFQERFEKPLESQTDEVLKSRTATRLKRLIRPFFLRRTKREVLKELPEKIEQVFWCEMSPTQRDIYRTILEEGREEVRSARRRVGQNGARMTMLTVILRLRQVCCDLRLIGLPESQLSKLDSSELSGKWGAFDGLLDGVLAAKGKVLVFSQFVSYLQACKQHLNSRCVGYAYLDGSTKERDEEVRGFQSNPSKPVFLISLKAGGYGLNLTQADHVFLMDPWWNPAVEAQAIDRAHRFGQTRVVNAYRFAMRGTVEERVLTLQQKKRYLISSTIGEQAPMMEGLKDADLEELLDV